MSATPVTITAAPAAAKAVAPDFVNVRLSAAGKAFAGPSGKVRIATAHMHYIFVGDTPQRVVYRGDWTKTLSSTKWESKCLFELVPDSNTAATTAASITAPAGAVSSSSEPAETPAADTAATK